MKKYYIVIITLFLVNVARGQVSNFSSSINPNRQGNHPVINLQDRPVNSVKNMVWETSDLFAEKHSGEPINHRTSRQRSLIQIYDSIYDWGWDTLNNVWKINSKQTDMVYNGNNMLTSEMVQIWNGSSWENNQKFTYTFDANNNLLSKLYQNWNGSVWENYIQYLSTYDVNNNETSKTLQIWSGTAWENNEEYINTYDANDNRTNVLYQIWNGIAWENFQQWINTYDLSNNLINQLSQGWNGAAWEDANLTTNSYDANNNKTSSLFQNWNGSTWVNYNLTGYTYDPGNNLTNQLLQHWNGNAWLNSMQWLFTYDASNNMESVFEQKWVGNAWVNFLRENLTYDANNFIESEASKFWNEFGTKINGGDSIYYYFHTVVGVNELKDQNGKIVVYPNPASDQITIETSVTLVNVQLSIMNQAGQELITRQISESKSVIDISNLPGGVYFVRLTNDKTVEVGKFIKE